MVGMLIAASLVLCSWSVMFRDWTSRNDTRWLLSLQLAIILIASITPNVWIALALVWVAIHPLLTHVTFSRGLLPFSPTGPSTYQPLIPILWWGTFYTVFRLYPVSFTIIAYTLIIWGLFNSIMAIYEELNPTLPHWFKDGRTPYSPNAPGLVGGSFLLAFITAAGFISAVTLLSTANTYTSIIIFITLSLLLALSSLHSGTLSPIMCACAVITAWFIRDPVFIATPIVALGLASHDKLTRLEHQGSLISRYPAWLSAIDLTRNTYYVGIGLGMWNAATNPPMSKEQHDTEWRNLHNDWLQSIVELSPIPCVCGLMLLAISWFSLYHSSSITHVYGLLMTTFIALYAIVYFPMRDHMPSMLLAISLSMLT